MNERNRKLALATWGMRAIYILGASGPDEVPLVKPGHSFPTLDSTPSHGAPCSVLDPHGDNNTDIVPVPPVLGRLSASLHILPAFPTAG